MPTFKGLYGTSLQREDLSHTYGQGSFGTIEYVGPYNSILGLFQPLADAGWEFTTRNEGSYTRLTASRQGVLDDPEDDFHDRFTITKETIEKDIWTLDEIHEEVDLKFGTDFDLFKDVVTKAIQDGDVSQLTPFPIDTYPALWATYTELSRGVEAYEEEYTVLTRERVVPYPSNRRLTLPQKNTQYIYSNSQLLGIMGLTAIAGITLPTAPANNDTANTQWGWRSRRRGVQFMEGQKIQIVEDWAWAAWSTNIYTVYSG